MKTGPGLTVKPVGFGKSKFKAEHSVRATTTSVKKMKSFLLQCFKSTKLISLYNNEKQAWG